MKKYIYFLTVFVFIFLVIPHVNAAEANTDTLIKASLPAVYYYADDGKRYVFPNKKTYNSWFSNFNNVITVSDDFLASIPIGGNVTYRPGVKMVKIQTDPKVYHVSRNGTLRWVKTEDLAMQLYGNNWNMLVDDVPDAFFTNYIVGQEINSVYDIDPTQEVNFYTTINKDKGIVQSANPLYSDVIKNLQELPDITISKSTYRWVEKSLNKDPYFHKGLVLESVVNGFVGTWYDDRNGQNEVMYQKIDKMGDAEGSLVRVSSNLSDSVNGKTVYNNNMYTLWEDASPIKRAIYVDKFNLVGNSIKESIYTSTTYATSKNPDFVWNETNQEFGISWWDTRNSQNGILGNLFFGRLTKGGLKIGDIVKVTDNPELEFSPSIFSLGKNYMLFWQESESKKIKSALVNNLGVLQSINTIATPTSNTNFKVSWNGSNIGILWNDNNKVYYAKISPLGAKLGGNVEILDFDARDFDIEWDGAEYAVVYQKDNDIFYLEINDSGILLNTEVNITNSVNISSAPDLKKSATGFAVAWLEEINNGLYNEIKVAIRNE